MDLEVPFDHYTTENGRKTHPLFRRQTHIYIIDHVPIDAHQNNAASQEHQDKCELVRDFFQQNTNFPVNLVPIAPGDNADTFTTYWTNQLQGNGVGDLVILYYHGKAGGKGTDYTWRFCGNHGLHVNAYNLIQQIHDTEADCMLLLDCFVPTRFRDKWQADDANIEVISSGQRPQDHNGNIILDDGDFTRAMVSSMEGLLRGVNGGTYQGVAPRSIPQVMGHNQDLASNPLRLWHKKPKKGREDTIIKRIQIYPPEMHRTGTIEFIAVQIQPLQPAEDEGYGGENAEGNGEGNGGGNEAGNGGILFVAP